MNFKMAKDSDDCCFPNYQGGSVLNLMASVIRARGGTSPHGELSDLPAECLRGASAIALAVIDGLGTIQLKRYLKKTPDSPFFGTQPYRTLTTVFPATSATALTTFTTGASPAEHAILGWHVNLPDVGMVVKILPLESRLDMPAFPRGFDLKRYLALPSHVDSMRRRKIMIAPHDVADSAYARMGTRWNSIVGANTLRQFENALWRATRNGGYVYAYWPHYDALCHDHGTSSANADAHLLEVDRRLARVSARLKDTGVVLLVTADHGLVDASPASTIDLSRIPGFYDCLATLPAGDKRSVFCWVRPYKVAAFKKIVVGALRGICACYDLKRQLQGDLYGPGPHHRQLKNRLGDYLLVARKRFALESPVPGMKPRTDIGKHGGMSPSEMLVPLYITGGRNYWHLRKRQLRNTRNTRKKIG